jgi:hypothetical protein
MRRQGIEKAEGIVVEDLMAIAAEGNLDEGRE